MPSKSGILFYGDPHGRWQPLLDEYARHPAKAVVLLGDCELSAPLAETLKPISTDGCPIHWIYGNHDNHTENQWDNLTSAPSGLHGRVTDVAGLRLAGLGGNYAAKIWYPKVGNEEPRLRTRREFLKSLPRSGRPGTELPLERRALIFSEDHDALKRLRADVLVCHEAPTSHPHGFGGIDELAKAMRVRLVVHGHHHVGYRGASQDGIEVRGLGIAECWRHEV